MFKYSSALGEGNCGVGRPGEAGKSNNDFTVRDLINNGRGENDLIVKIKSQ
jgi:hypothetical protein